jgi:hypothetical protein
MHWFPKKKKKRTVLNAIRVQIVTDASLCTKDAADCRYHLLPAIIVFLEVAACSEVTERVNLTSCNRASAP